MFIYVYILVYSDNEEFEFQDKPSNGRSTVDNDVTVQTLTPDEISKKMFEIVDDVNAVFQVHTYIHTVYMYI